MNKTTRVLLTAILCATAVACTKKVKEDPNAGGTTGPGTSGTTTPGVTTGPMGGSGTYGPGDLDTDACLRQRVVYFDFDQDALKPEFQNIVACHAKYLRDRPSARITLEGNADERGSREYNLALGQKRAEAVRRALIALGVSESQLEAVSLGEEKARSGANDDAALAENRRADLVYQ